MKSSAPAIPPSQAGNVLGSRGTRRPSADTACRSSRLPPGRYWITANGSPSYSPTSLILTIPGCDSFTSDRTSWGNGRGNPGARRRAQRGDPGVSDPPPTPPRDPPAGVEVPFAGPVDDPHPPLAQLRADHITP